MNKWQPIESAPKDGTLILTFGGVSGDWGEGYAVAAWADDHQEWWPYLAGWPVYADYKFDRQPTHWMRLPEPPK